MVGPADYGLRTGRVGVLKREHQRRISALTRLARGIGAAPHGCGSCNRSVGRKLARSRSTSYGAAVDSGHKPGVCRRHRNPYTEH